MSQNDQMTVPSPSEIPEEALDLRVYEWVRERVIDGTFKPGERIRERTLAEELHVSRIPIREAFPRLESEGYIRTLHRRGAIVAEMTVQDVRELFEVRAALEVLAARLAADECARGASGERLMLRLAAAEDAVRDRDAARIASCTAELHDEILVLSNSRLLQNLMVPVRGRIRRLFHVVTQRDGVGLHREHRDLCSAIVNGQTELAAALALAHVEHSRYETMPIVQRLLRR
ncbi:GntR family transcriptional regulator [Microbacterium mangrovi]|nr:GntR family transcriptional regulator [Microbacterium mangrovi]